MNGVYYKATRPDGYAFHCDQTLYEVGKRIRPRPSSGRRIICGPGYLHASDVPAGTLVGGSWPCRLFEVKGKPVVGFDDRHPHKGGFHQLTVVKELPAHRVFGPQGKEIVALVERARRLTHEEARELDAAWGAATAILTRDLIGSGYYTQAHHDLLYGPWKKVIG